MRYQSLQDWLLHFPNPETNRIKNSLIEEARQNIQVMSLQNAITNLMNSWDESLKTKNFYDLVETAFLLSLIVPPKQQTEWRLVAIKTCQNNMTDLIFKSWLCYLIQLDGWHSFDLKKYPESLDSFAKALSLTEDSQEIIHIKWAQARIYRAQNKMQEALDLQLKILDELSALELSNGHIYLEIAECYQYFHKKIEAKQFFEKAFHELSKDKWFTDNRKDELEKIEEIYKKKY